MSRQRGGDIEDTVLTYLKDQGLNLVARNFLCKVGEIDLIMCEGKVLAFIEVRYRKSNAFGSAAATVTRSKQLKLIKAAQVYLQSSPHFKNAPCRFDAVCIVGEKAKDLQISWLKSAFDLG